MSCMYVAALWTEHVEKVVCLAYAQGTAAIAPPETSGEGLNRFPLVERAEDLTNSGRPYC